MRSALGTSKSMAVALAAVVFAIVPPFVSAQGTQAESFRVLINAAVVGTATSAANLPTDAVVIQQDSNPNLPRRQVISGQQGSVILTSEDPALISAFQAWIKADNSGYKDTVQRKTVEIDRLVGTGGTSRYRLSDAWPSRIDAAGGTSTITIVYQRLDMIP